MSPISAAIFLGLSLILLALFRRPAGPLMLAGVWSVAVGPISLTILLACLYHVPLFGSYSRIPVAPLVALSFFLFTIALAAALGQAGPCGLSLAIRLAP